MMLHFADLFTNIADSFGDDLALVHGESRLTWAEFSERAVRFASYLKAVGVGPGDKVGFLLYNSPEYLIAQFGVFLRRAIPVNINYRYIDAELVYLCNDSGAKVVISHASLAARMNGIRHLVPTVRSVVVVADDERPVPHVEAAQDATWTDSLRTYDHNSSISGSEDDVYMLYTGGTTGMPKGVMFRMGDFVHRMFTGYVYRGWNPPTADTLLSTIAAHRAAGDRRISIPACPLMHGTGMWLGAFYAHLMGGAVVTLPGRSFRATELWATAQREDADAITIVGDAFARPMLDELNAAAEAGRPYALGALRIMQSSGVMWSAEVQAGLLHHLDIRLVDSMGSTEGGMAKRVVTRGTPIETARFEALPGTKLIAADGTVVRRGEKTPGRVAASAVVPLGYFNDPVKSSATFVEIDGVRHAMAGDWAVWADETSFVLLGRGSNCINTAGEKVFPEEVEEAMKRLPAVADCLVVGLPDARLGQTVAAVVSLRPSDGTFTDNQRADELVSNLRTVLAGYKVPRLLHLVPEVQRAANGKADYLWATSELTEAASARQRDS